MKSPMPVYQLKLTLRDTKPPIWRRVQVAGDISFIKLHQVIQLLMSWEDYHLWSFEIDRVSYEPKDPTAPKGFLPDFGEPARSAAAKLVDVVGDQLIKFNYTYDFGDNWEVDLKVEKILAPEEGAVAVYAHCLDGKRAAPPEDCGGVWGYASLLEILSDPNHEEHESMLEWIGGEWDAEAFDSDAVNRELARRFNKRVKKKDHVVS